jgi:flagellar motor component MotA
MILWNADLAKRLACPDEEKTSLPLIIKDLLRLATKSRIEGPKALLNEAATAKNSMLSYGLRLIGEGLSVESLEEILSIYLAVSPSSGFEFLKLCLYVETLVSIAAGDSPELTLRKLAPYCGIEKSYALLASLESQA